jgi:hypothetical protein
MEHQVRNREEFFNKAITAIFQEMKVLSSAVERGLSANGSQDGERDAGSGFDFWSDGDWLRHMTVKMGDVARSLQQVYNSNLGAIEGKLRQEDLNQREDALDKALLSAAAVMGCWLGERAYFSEMYRNHPLCEQPSEAPAPVADGYVQLPLPGMGPAAAEAAETAPEAALGEYQSMADEAQRWSKFMEQLQAANAAETSSEPAVEGWFPLPVDPGAGMDAEEFFRRYFNGAPPGNGAPGNDSAGGVFVVDGFAIFFRRAGGSSEPPGAGGLPRN